MGISFSRRTPIATSVGQQTAARAVGKSSTRETSKQFADKGRGFQSQSAFNTGVPNASMSELPMGIDSDPLLDGMDYDLDDRACFNLYRDMYHHDPVAGCVVDLYSTLPFSEFTLSGGESRYLAPYQEVIERLSFRTIFPQITVDYLVTGSFLGSMLFNKREKTFEDLMTHRADNATIKPLPFVSQDPIIEMTVAEEIRETLRSDSPRIEALRKRLGNEFIDKLLNDRMELDPLSTIYIPRKSFSFGSGTSFFKRILPLFLIEKNLYRGTLIESGKRQRGIMHIQMGDGDQWEATPEDLEAALELFQNADADPLGAIVATRLGVMIDELRQGGDFWKITDIWDQTTQFKMRALGVGDAFLSGDANYSCVTGNSLLQTDHGLIRIGAMVDHNTETQEVGKPVKIDTKHAGRYSPVKGKVWIYSGHQDTYRIETKEKYHITGTDKHPTLVFNRDTGSTEWKNILDIESGDLVCVSTRRFSCKENPKLNLMLLEDCTHGGQMKEVNVPQTMTPELAWILGAVAAEGNVSEHRITLSNSDFGYIDRFMDNVESVFGIECSYGVKELAGKSSIIKGIATESTQTHYYVNINSKQIANIFDQLGSAIGSISTDKHIPWSVLESTEECQVAFVGAYVEGDGCVQSQPSRVVTTSFSEEMLSEFQILYTSWGIPCSRKNNSIQLDGKNAVNLYRKIHEHLVSKVMIFDDDSIDKARKLFGVPAEYFISEMKKRAIKSNRYGTTFTTYGGEVLLSGVFKGTPDKRFLYDAYDRGHYDHFIDCMRQVHPELHEKFVELMECRYHFAEVSSVSHVGKEHVYDISVTDGQEPAFVANGIVIHNTMEGSMTVFIESIRAHRDHITRCALYNKVFPLVAMLKGLQTNRKGKIVQKDNLMQGNIEDLLRTQNDGSRLFIPQVHWNKQLKPEGDQAYMDMLTALEEKGVPVPLRALAAAGGFNLDTLLSQQDEDLSIMKDIGKYKQKVNEVKSAFGGGGGDDMGGGGGFGGFSSMSKVLDNGQLRGFNRDFGEAQEIVGQTKTGKKKYVHNQRLANRKANEAMNKALINLRQKPSTLTHRSVTPFSPRTTGLNNIYEN